MDQPLWRRHVALIAFCLADVFAIGLGMGVPVFAVALGFVAGWWVARRALAEGSELRDAVRRVLAWGLALAGTSLAALLLTWGPQIGTVLDPAVSATNWGIPLVLYTSQASKIGWFVLMVAISPVLEFMAVAAAGMVTLGMSRR